MPPVSLTAEGTRRAAHGNSLNPSHVVTQPQGGWHLSGKGASHVRLLDGEGGLIAIAEPRPDGLLHPLVVLG